ncbi:helix-turn-helix domain-containing protein [Micromonospora sp. NPDC049891]|uniref:helix-turn-helix domain-containing protein n=1 Tax=Micromonospora sp. NPDC049891 TaxID=3155655 RepID=UPI0033D2C0E9
MSWVWDHSPVGGTDRLVLLAIADCAADDGTDAWPSIATLARKTRVDTRTVQRVIRRLVEGGHLMVDTTAGGRKSNTYTVVMSESDPRQNATPGSTPPPAESQGTPGATPPQPRRSYATRTSFNRPVPTQRGAALPVSSKAPDRCPNHPGQYARWCGPCRSEAVGSA